MTAFYRHLQFWLGLEMKPEHLTVVQMSLRALVIFLIALVMLRVAHKRFFARRNAIDVLLTFVLASTLARAINGGAAFFPTIGAGFILIFLHRGLTWACMRIPALGKLVKGSPVPLVVDGRVDEDVMCRHNITRNDLDEDLRLKGTQHVSEVDIARLERNGEISILRKNA